MARTVGVEMKRGQGAVGKFAAAITGGNGYVRRLTTVRMASTSTGTSAGSQTGGAQAIGRMRLNRFGRTRLPFVLVGAGLLYSTYAVIPAGHTGIIDTFGKVSEDKLISGFHLKNPLSRVKLLSLMTKKEGIECSVPSAEGLMVSLKVELQYRLDETCVVSLYQTVGMDYMNVLVQPILSATIREVTCKRDAKAMYTSDGRHGMQSEIISLLREKLSARGIIVEDCCLTRVVLPRNLSDAIERKLEMEQESQRMGFVLIREEQEAKRKAIEAQGIQKFQEIVSKGIDEKLLKWKGIEATQELANSQNSKVVIVGGGKDGLPLILGN